VRAGRACHCGLDRQSRPALDEAPSLDAGVEPGMTAFGTSRRN